jgi:ABC-2 type transport system permease protein
MLKIITAAVKELVLLKRDRAGLLVLFLMPALLVIVITLVQENVMELTGQKKTLVLFLDLDEGDLGKSLRQQLETGQLEIVVWDKRQKTKEDIQAAVAEGEYQVGVIIPEGSTRKVQEETALLFQKDRPPEKNSPASQVPVLVYFDPGVMPGFRTGLTAQLQMALEAIAIKTKMEELDRELHSLLDSLGVAEDFAPLPSAGLSELTQRPLFILKDNRAGSGPTEVPPYNPVQQNVPAWALFGMFFTSIPIAGAILQERKSGIWIRLASLPVSNLLLFAGKVVAYLGVCFCQFLLVGLIGTFLFSYMGLPAFTVSGNLAAVLVIVFFSSLAACGFGIFLGMVCGSYEQASTLGSTAVVAAAALGGVMVPVYAMPQMMQRLSIISPLNWGLTAFHDLLVRGNSLSAIWDDLGRLMLFFLLTIFLAWRLARPRI